jgi:hypothetical protein
MGPSPGSRCAVGVIDIIVVWGFAVDSGVAAARGEARGNVLLLSLL